MASLQEELSKSLYLYTSGSSIEAVRGEDVLIWRETMSKLPFSYTPADYVINCLKSVIDLSYGVDNHESILEMQKNWKKIRYTSFNECIL